MEPTNDMNRTTDILDALRDRRHSGHLNSAAAAEIERLREANDAAWRQGAVAVLRKAYDLADPAGGDIALPDLLEAFPDLAAEAESAQ